MEKSGIGKKSGIGSRVGRPAIAVLGIAVLLFMLAAGLSGCSKSETRPSPQASNPNNGSRPGQPLLDSMVWPQYATTAYFAYRPDSLQDKITTVSSYVSDTDRFEYKGRQISRIYNLRLGRSTAYTYNALGQITVTRVIGYADGNIRFEYGYDTAGKLRSLTNFLEKPAGKQLLSTFTYEYDPQGLPSKINGVTRDGVRITTTIDGYSDECNFNPWVFIEPADVNVMAQIYNLPFLQGLKRLPQKITTVYSDGSDGLSQTQPTIIRDHNLSGISTSVHFPIRPEHDYQFDIAFFYRH
jgi:hypothetical protein